MVVTDFTDTILTLYLIFHFGPFHTSTWVKYISPIQTLHPIAYKLYFHMNAPLVYSLEVIHVEWSTKLFIHVD